MKFNLSKSKIIVHEGRKEGVPDLCNADEEKEEDNAYLNTQLEVVEGKIVLGNPIGGESYRKQVIKQSVEEMWKPFKGLLYIDGVVDNWYPGIVNSAWGRSEEIGLKPTSLGWSRKEVQRRMHISYRNYRIYTK
jgi:hypothetical protein